MGNHTLHPGRKAISLNGTNSVVVCKSPGSDLIREVIALRVSNIDNAVVTLTLKRSFDGGTATQVDKVTGLAVDAVWAPIDTTKPIVLYPNDSLTMVMSGAAGLTNPIAYAEYRDYRFWQ